MRLLADPNFLSSTIGRIYDCVGDPARWEPLIADLAGLIGARRGALGVATMRGAAQLQVMHGYADIPLERVVQYAPINPGLPYGMVWPYDRSFVFSRDMGLDRLKASRFWREYLAPLGDADCITFLLTREGDAFGHWALITQDDRAPITEQEAEGFTLIAPHMRRAVEIARLLNVQRLEADTYRGALDQLNSAVLILDRRRRVAHANPRGEAALAAGTVLQMRDRELRGATEEVEAVLRRVSQGAAAGGAAGTEAKIIGTDGDGEAALRRRARHAGGRQFSRADARAAIPARGHVQSRLRRRPRLQPDAFAGAGAGLPRPGPPAGGDRRDRRRLHHDGPHASVRPLPQDRHDPPGGTRGARSLPRLAAPRRRPGKVRQGHPFSSI